MMPQQFQSEGALEFPFSSAIDNEVSLMENSGFTAQSQAVIDQFLQQACTKIHHRRRLFVSYHAASLLPIFYLLIIFPLINNMSLSLYLMNNLLSLLWWAVFTHAKHAVYEPKSIGFGFEELAELGGVRMIGALAELHHLGLKGDQAAALRSALATLLPQLKASDARCLTSAQRKALYSLLRKNAFYDAVTVYPEDLILALIQALGQIGDVDAIPIVERLTHLEPESTHLRRVRNAARECLPHLLQNAGIISQQQMLLRSSSADTAAVDLLLHPVGDYTETPARELLHTYEFESEL